MERFRETKLYPVALAITLMAGAATFAVTSGTARGNEEWGPNHAEKMKQFDKNGDGKLDDAEKQAMRAQFEARRKELIARFDQDHDGKLNDAERKEMHKTLAAEWFKKLDTDGDGRLTLAEFQAGAEQFAGHHGFGRHGH